MKLSMCISVKMMEKERMCMYAWKYAWKKVREKKRESVEEKN